MLRRIRKTEIATIFDVGVFKGTELLYEAYPDSRLVLIDPFFDNQVELEKKLEGRDYKLMKLALGSEEKKMIFRRYPDFGGLSGFAPRTELSSRDAECVYEEITTHRLDKIVSENVFPKPYCLKIDTEGFEKEVILGAEGILKDCHMIIMEVSIAPRFENGYTFTEMLTFMEERGFFLHDMLNVKYTYLTPKGQVWNGALYCDAVFINRSAESMFL